MHAYGFEIEEDQYYILAASPVKPETIKKQGFDRMRSINDTIRKLYGERDGSYRVPFGTVFNDMFGVVSSPEVAEVDHYDDSESEDEDELCGTADVDDAECYANVDATFIHLYRIDGRVMLGTRNSWDITHSKDLYEKLTYGDAFYSCLKRLGLSVDQLPNGTYAFSHPLLHLTANDYRVYSFTNPSIAGVSLEFDPCSDEDCITYYPYERVYTVTESEERDSLHRLLYNRRWRFRRGADGELTCDELGMINCMLNYYCNASPSTRGYVKSTLCLNDYSSYCLDFVTSLIKGIFKVKRSTTRYHGVDIPEDMDRSKGVASPKYYRFWQKVLANAYNQSFQTGELPKGCYRWSMNFAEYY